MRTLWWSRSYLRCGEPIGQAMRALILDELCHLLEGLLELYGQRPRVADCAGYLVIDSF